ncbi:MAG: hypothetical protein E7169_05250 [Firmicutes bacterium]|nr:hypothetical protein [Bacillota bacterium]
MSLVDENIKEMANRLAQEREIILKKRELLFNDFWKYANTKFKELEPPFQISYSLVNGDENINFNDLNMGEDVKLELFSFIYIPQTSCVTDYIKKEYIGVKLSSDFITNVHMSGQGISRQSYSSYPKELITERDNKKINDMIQSKIQEILTKIFNRQLSFEDDEFKRLVITNIAIDRELKRIEARINALNDKKR